MRTKARGLSAVASTAFLLISWILPAPSLAANDPVVIRLWDVHVHDKKFRKDIFKEFNAANPDIKVEYTSQISSTYSTILEAAFRTNNPPEIFMPTEGGIQKMLELGRIMPLDDVAPTRADFDKFKALFPENLDPFLESVNVLKGKTWSWPIKASEGPAYIMLYYNTRLFSEAGLKGPGGGPAGPETWDEMRLFAKKITELEPGKTYGMVFGGITSQVWKWNIYYTLAKSTGWDSFSSWGFDLQTGRWDYHHPGFRGAIQLWLDMKKDGSIFPGTGSMDDEQAKYKFSQNLAGMMFNGPWTPGGLIAVNPDLEFDFVSPPTEVRGDRKGVLPVQKVAVNSEYLVSSKITNREAVWRVITFMTSQAYQEGWVKAGGGISVFPQYNKSAYFPHPTIAKIAQINAAGISVSLGAGGLSEPPDWWPVRQFYDPGRPDIFDTMEGQWIGQLGWQAWDNLERRANDAWDKAIAEASDKYGVKFTQADFIFSDFDSAKPYASKRTGK